MLCEGMFSKTECVGMETEKKAKTAGAVQIRPYGDYMVAVELCWSVYQVHSLPHQIRASGIKRITKNKNKK